MPFVVLVCLWLYVMQGKGTCCYGNRKGEAVKNVIFDVSVCDLKKDDFILRAR